MATSLVKGKVAGDVVKYFESSEYSLDEAVLRNGGGGLYTDVEIGGRPVAVAAGVATLVEGAGEAAANGIVAEQGIVTLAAAGQTTKLYPILARSGVIWESALSVTDPLGGGLDIAAIVTALAAVGIISRPGKSAMGSEQVT